MSFLPASRRRSQLWDPFSTLREIDNAMAKWGGDWQPVTNGLQTLALDVRDEPNRYIVEVNAPGVDRKDLDISFENGMLTFAVSKSGEREDTGENYVVRERFSSGTSRSVSLALADPAGKIDASLKDGVLTVIVPKQPEKQTRKVEIR